MARTVECPKCGEDISDTYEPSDQSVGIMSSGWFCEKCDLPVPDEGDDNEFDFEPTYPPAMLPVHDDEAEVVIVEPRKQ